jgi:hypothetical protein
MHWLAAFDMDDRRRCPKNRRAGAYFGGKARDFKVLRRQRRAGDR